MRRLMVTPHKCTTGVIRALHGDALGREPLCQFKLAAHSALEMFMRVSTTTANLFPLSS